MLFDILKFAGFLGVVLVALWFIEKSSKARQRKLMLGAVFVFAFVLITVGVQTLLSGSEISQAGGKYGTVYWYQDLAAGILLLLAAFIAWLKHPTPKEEKEADPDRQRTTRGM